MRSLLCPERQYEAIYGKYCDYRISELRYYAVKLQQGYGDGNFAPGTRLLGAYGMNDNGEVVGKAKTKNGDIHAVQVQVGPRYNQQLYFTGLGTPGLASTAYAISNEFTVVGEIQMRSSDRRMREAKWYSQHMSPLNIDSSGYGAAVDLAKDRFYTDYVTGYSSSPATGGIERAFLWSISGIKYIGEGNRKSRGEAVNDSQIVVGYIVDGNNTKQAFKWQYGSIQYLGNFGRASHALGINNNASPKIVGYSTSRAGRAYAFLWDNKLIKLPSLPRAKYAVAKAINDVSDIVGASGGKAVIWRNNKIYDLNTRLTETLTTSLVQAIDINRMGRILVKGKDGYFYVLIPSEEN